jgi:threonine dehydratase
MSTQVATTPEVSLREFQEARKVVSSFAYHTPLLTSRLLSERTGFDVRLKAEIFQKGGAYKLRGPLNKFRYLTEEQRQRGVICSSAGNHAQGVALAANVYKMKAVVVMAKNATQSKIDATRAYGAEVVSPDRELWGWKFMKTSRRWMSPWCRSAAGG